MEIERKFLMKMPPRNLGSYESAQIEQAYLCTQPVIRIRKKNDEYILTYKSVGLLEREELEVPLDEKSYQHLLKKCDGNVITKTRYFIPIEDGLTVEVDIFKHGFDGLIIAEVEFPDLETATAFRPPIWLKNEVTQDPRFQNSNLCQMTDNERITILREILYN